MQEVSTALLFDKNGKFLIYLRDDKDSIPFPNHWDLFGGHVEEGESPETALLREIEEELGITVSSYEKFKTYHCLKDEDVHENIKHVYVAYTDKAWENLTLYEGQYHKGIELSEAKNYPFANILGRIIQDYISHKEAS